MRGKTLHIGLTAALAICIGFLFVTSASAAAQETVLHSFRFTLPLRAQPNDGCVLLDGNLISDAAGNLYGTTSGGGFFRYGTVFKLTGTGGGWTESILFNFGRDYASGHNPTGGLVLDASGNLYGTTETGGDYNQGLVLELVQNADGTWTEKVLHSFNGMDGSRPWATLIFDAAGNLYGTTEMGGAYNGGTAFELTPTGGGNWSEQVLHSFGSGADGAYPLAPLVFDAAGNLYGTASYGGQYLGGTAFELSSAIGGGWTEQVLHNFGSGVDGQEPFSGALMFDSAGNLYGTTFTGGTHHTCEGGSSSCGTVYRLTPTRGGTWAEQVLYSFDRSPDGNFPDSSLVFDAAGNLYGTTFFGGGGRYNAGTVFKLTPGGANWTEQVLYSFSGLADGDNPAAGLLAGGEGNFYGTTQAGGAYGCGTVFEVRP
jgi:uncharacterized repeat protein (TIGR03803 family)